MVREFRENPTRQIMKNHYEICSGKKKLAALWTGAVIDLWPGTAGRKKKNEFLKECNSVTALTGRCLFLFTLNLCERRAPCVSLNHLEYQMERGIKMGFRSLNVEECGLP